VPPLLSKFREAVPSSTPALEDKSASHQGDSFWDEGFIFGMKRGAIRTHLDPEEDIMNTDHRKQFKAQKESNSAQRGRENRKLPKPLDQLEWVAQQEFVPRLKSIVRVMLDDEGAIAVKRGACEDCPGTVVIDLTFGRKEGADGHWTAFLVRVELDPQTNMVCIQAGSHMHMNRQFPFGGEGWDSKLIDSFEWMLSDSMRSNLRVRDWSAAP
jgi:hypothetical protein